jgi:hypothetical protein
MLARLTASVRDRLRTLAIGWGSRPRPTDEVPRMGRMFRIG